MPDIPIMQVNTTVIKKNDKYVDKIDYINKYNKWESKEVINVADKKITIIDSNDDTSMVIIIIAVSALLLIALILGARYLYNKMRIEKAKAEEIKNTQKNLHKKG